MYTAIIIDDEKKVCQLIQKLGEWDKLGIQIIDICTDGEEAMKSIAKNRPDIALTDIRMPVYDGLDLVKYAHTENIDTVFIIISGYKQFEYAQNALHYDVIDFLVKPIEKDLLNETLLKACGKINKKRKVMDQNRRIEELTEEKNKVLKENLLTNLLMGQKVENDSIHQFKKEYDVNFKNGIFQAFFIKTNRSELNEEKSVFSQKVISYLEQELTLCHELITVSKKEGVYGIINYDEEDKSGVISAYSRICSKIEKLEDTYNAFSVTLGIGKPVDSIGKVSDSIHTAVIACQAKLLCSKKDFIFYENLTFNYIDSQQLLDERELKRFELITESYQTDEMILFMNQLESKILKQGFLLPSIILELGETLLSHFLFALHYEDAGKKKEYAATVRKNAENAESIGEFCNIYKRSFINIMKEVYEYKREEESTPVKDAKAYIKENYNTTISLEEISEYVQLSPVYFSRLFKKVEGKNYIDYLTEIRMEAAKEKLRLTRASIECIALEIGYSDEKYFRKLFKKYNGIKPTEYRKLH